jgi:hypothetical protein
VHVPVGHCAGGLRCQNPSTASAFIAEDAQIQALAEPSHGPARAVLGDERCGGAATSASELPNTKNPRLITEGQMVDMKL